MRDAAADQAAGDEAGAVEWGGAGASVSGGIVREEHLNHETGERARKARKLSCVSRMFAPFAFQIAADAQDDIIGYLDGVQAQVAELKRLADRVGGDGGAERSGAGTRRAVAAGRAQAGVRGPFDAAGPGR